MMPLPSVKHSFQCGKTLKTSLRSSRGSCGSSATWPSWHLQPFHRHGATPIDGYGWMVFAQWKIPSTKMDGLNGHGAPVNGWLTYVDFMEDPIVRNGWRFFWRLPWRNGKLQMTLRSRFFWSRKMLLGSLGSSMATVTVITTNGRWWVSLASATSHLLERIAAWPTWAQYQRI